MVKQLVHIYAVALNPIDFALQKNKSANFIGFKNLNFSFCLELLYNWLNKDNAEKNDDCSSNFSFSERRRYKNFDIQIIELKLNNV